MWLFMHTIFHIKVTLIIKMKNQKYCWKTKGILKSPVHVPLKKNRQDAIEKEPKNGKEN